MNPLVGKTEGDLLRALGQPSERTFDHCTWKAGGYEISLAFDKNSRCTEILRESDKGRVSILDGTLITDRMREFGLLPHELTGCTAGGSIHNGSDQSGSSPSPVHLRPEVVDQARVVALAREAKRRAFLATPEAQAAAAERAWRRRHSLWVLWSLPLGFTGFIGLFYVAARVRNWRWMVYATAYGVPFAVAFILSNSSLKDSAATDVAIVAAFVAGVVCFAHSMRIRPSYLTSRYKTRRIVTREQARKEVWKSLWMLWFLPFGLTGFVGLLYAGLRARRRRWIVVGLLTSIPVAMTVGEPFGSNSIETTTIGCVCVATIVFSFLYALDIRDEYLDRLSARGGRGKTVTP